MKILKYYVLQLVLFISTGVYAQNLKPLANRIMEARNANLVFQEVKLFEKSNGLRPGKLPEGLSNASYFEYNSSAAEQLRKTPIANISVEIPSALKKQGLVLDLVKVPSTFYDFEVVTSNGEKYNGASFNVVHYQGIVRGRESTSMVAISLLEDQIMGIVSLEGEGNYNLGKLKETNLYIFYKDLELKSPPRMDCGTPNDLELYNPSDLFESFPLQAAAKCVNIYLETEYDIYQNKGSVANVVSYITGLFNQVAILYSNESIQIKLSQIKVWTSADPYTGTNTATLLSQFQSQTSSINGDLGQLLTFRSVGGGRAAGFSGICNANVDQKLSVSGIYTTYSNVPTYSWSVMVVTHEFGHLFGSRHTHACVWNGNNTAIDGCSGSTEGTCALPGIPAAGGTIMSYCHLQSVGINFNLGFGPQPGNVIRNSVANGSCIGNCISCPANLTITQNVNSGNTDNQQASNSITASNQIFNNATANYHAGNLVRLVPGFRAHNGSYLRAYIGACTSFTNADDVVLGETGSAKNDLIAISNLGSSNFDVYPNPSRGELTIGYPFKTNLTYQIQLYDFKGNMVLNQKITGNSNKLTFHELPDGIYLIKMVEANRYYSKKIVLNR